VDYFNDRRPYGGPREEDYQTPVSRDSLVDANARLRDATPQYRLDDRNRTIRTLAVQRHRSRRSGEGDFASVGEYLEFLAGAEPTRPGPA
jgi:hypothetical protein